jgi:topoisomerase-4 subunit A
VVIREIPFGTTTESVIASIESAVQKGRLKVAKISDYTTDRVEIELTLPRGVKSAEVIPQLFAYTDCSVSVSSNPVLIDQRRPILMGVSEVLRACTDQLKERLGAELEWERSRCQDQRHWLTLEQIFVEQRVYERLERAASAEALAACVWEGMAEHQALFVRPMRDEDVTRLLRLEIRRISAYDIERNRGQIAELEQRIAEIEAQLADLTGTTIAYLRELLDEYGDQFPRRTRVTRFDEIDVKTVARPTLKLAYDPKTRLFGSEVRGSRFKLAVSEHDLVLGIADDGSYRVMSAPEKVYFSGKLIHCEPFDPERGFELTLVYRDGTRIAWGKRVRIERFVRNREYRLIKDPKGRVDLLLADGREGIVSLEFAPAPRQRVKRARFDLTRLELTGVAARGTRLAAKPVARLKLLARKAKRASGDAPAQAASSQAAGRTAAKGQASLF